MMAIGQLYCAEMVQNLHLPLNVHTPLKSPSEKKTTRGMKEFRMVDLPLLTLALLTLASSTPATSPAPATTILTHPANLTRWIVITFHIMVIIIMLIVTINRAEGEKITLPCIVHNLGGDS